MYDGPNTNGLRLHPGSGFTSNTRPKITLTAESGEMLIRFTSDALHSSPGWQAEFSAGSVNYEYRPFLRNLNYLYRKICDLLLKIMVIIARQIFKISLNFGISF